MSPLLANIYLHELDQHMQIMKADFDKGRVRRPFPRYAALERSVLRLRRKIERLRADVADQAEIDAALAEIKAVNKERRKVPSVDPMDPNFKRLRYCCYADDFLIGVIGSKREACEIASRHTHPRGRTENQPHGTGWTDMARGTPPDHRQCQLASAAERSHQVL
ncbi:hypothetical protein [Bradyrhizobium sp. Gha]|uniref:hypothetical protein n=1 Tax=Bradyrhizobium sp. Gha TaxID=1855318 RepID=UPI000A90822F|nr:hypothetical protein [Bradyrhizobium sp. Gha]